MADYWKSNAKKYCETCKVWYADNKISAENHERGLKHKAMVQQRLRESSKKALEKEKKDAELQRTLIQMEQAALVSMSNEKKTNIAEESSQKTVKFKKLSKEQIKRNEYCEQKKKLEQLKKTAKKSQFWDNDSQTINYNGNWTNENDNFIKSNTNFQKLWVQATLETNENYYWHIFSGETRWDEPEEGYYTTEEYHTKYANIAANLSTNAYFLNSSNVISEISASNVVLNSKKNLAQTKSFEKDDLKNDIKLISNTDKNFSEEKNNIKEDFLLKNKQKKLTDESFEFKLHDLMEEKHADNTNNVINKNEEEKLKTNSLYSGLGPWIPVEKKEKMQQKISDLPEKTEKTANNVTEKLDLGSNELVFKEKVLPENRKKTSKTITFNKRLFKGKLRSRID